MYKIKSFAKKVLTWFDTQGRTHLPWQQEKTPYRVWVSEIMLQQTQVNTVIPYFLKFMQRFPTIQSLAEATEDEVLHYWTGLGYYARARNLLKCAKIMNDRKIFPSTLDDLINLPGIGRSTAGAIMSIGFQKKATILDGNVKRVLTRIYGIQEWNGSKKISEWLWQVADMYTPSTRVDDYSQAMMDLGATLCTRTKPNCIQCPFNKVCLSHQQGLENKIPIAKPTKILPLKKITWLIFQDEQTVFLQKRSYHNLWKNLWTFPEKMNHLSLNKIKTICEKEYGFSSKKISFGICFKHTFSHFSYEILPVFISVKRKLTLQDNLETMWFSFDDEVKLGLPQPVKKILLNTLSTYA